MAVAQIGTLNTFVTLTTLSSSNMNANFSDIKTAFNNLVTGANALNIDTISEVTAGGGVTIDSVVLKDGGATLSAALNMADNLIGRPKLQDYSIKGVNLGSITGNPFNINLESGNFFWGTVTGAATLVFQNPVASGDACGFILEITNGAAFTVTWPTSVDWPGGTAPTLQSSGVDVLAFVTRDGGTTWRGVLSMPNSS